MARMIFKIDEKSLFYGVYNDYERGQTATVHTPINQSIDPDKWHLDIINVLKKDPGLDVSRLPETLVDACLKKTTSQAESSLENFYIFNNIAFDGKKLNTDRAFAMYVKKEISEKTLDRNGSVIDNVHLGRLKLHYPTSLKYVQDGYNIDNKKVLDDILVQNGGFAFLVRLIEVDTEERYINFITSIIGIKGVLLSNVFKRQKGVGQKLLLESVEARSFKDQLFSQSTIDDVDSEEIIKSGNGNVDFEAINLARSRNGKKGEKYVMDNLERILKTEILGSFHTSAEYPTSPYDIEYYCASDSEKRYLEVKSTSGTKKVFNMSAGEIKFMEKYGDRYLLLLVTRVNDNVPVVDIFDKKQIMRMSKEYPTTRFFV